MLLQTRSLLAGIFCVVPALALAAEPGTTGRANPFFAFDNGVGRGLWQPAEQARVLKELGYDGIGYSGCAEMAQRVKAFQEHGLKVFSIYVGAIFDKPQPFDPQLKDALGALGGTEAIVWLTVRGPRGQHDDQAARVVGDVADLAKEHGIRVALYPHIGFYVATTDDALRIVKKAHRKNLGVSVNLCHELMAGNADRLSQIVTDCAPHLFLVSINGAEPRGGVHETIKTLDQGSFDILGFLKTLDRAGYHGPIGLQCYNLQGDPRANLKRSMDAWRKLSAQRH